VIQFAVGGIVALVALSIGAVLVLRGFGHDESVRDARSTTQLVATSIVAPAIQDGLTSMDPAAIVALDRAVAAFRPHTDMVRVKLWRADGTIVYSDEHRLIGERFELDDVDAAVLRQGGTHAGSTDLSAPENTMEPRGRALLSVYARVRTPQGRPLLFEAYFPDHSVVQGGRVISGKLLPLALGAIVLLALIQVPLAWAMARRIKAAHAERERLLRQAIHAEQAERRRIAADLHDGVVQDLAGMQFVLSAAAARLGPDAAAVRVDLEQAAAVTRRGIKQLRTLLVSIYPANLREAGLPRALEDLLAPVAGAGIATSFECPDDLVDLDADTEGLVYRTAQEALRNVVRHSGASHVTVAVRDHGRSLVIHDDGHGFDPDQVRGHDDGHFGLCSLRDLAEATGARFTIDSQAGHGTTVSLDLEPEGALTR
jgi:signal transduction histidine kinase